MRENANSTIKMLRPEQLWQPRIGAPLGNRNALKHGYHTRRAKRIRVRVRDLKCRARAAIAAVDRWAKALPVIPHQFACPVRFAYVAARQEPAHHGLDVQDRR